MLADVELSTGYIFVKQKQITLDLMGKNISTNANTAFVVTPKSAYDDTTTKSATDVKATSLTINNTDGNNSGAKGSIKSFEGWAITVVGDGNKEHAPSLIVNGGYIESDYGISGIGNVPDDKSERDDRYTNITINDGKISGTCDKNSAIYQPQEGTLIINGGEISGKTGIEIRSGSLQVNGGTIIGTGSSYYVQPNGDGSTTNGAGIAVAQHTTRKNIALEVTGGNISGVVGLSISNPQGNQSGEGELTVDIKGGTFTGSKEGSPIASGNADERVKVNISDGTFNGNLCTAAGKNLNTESLQTETKAGAYNITGGSFSYDVSAYVAEGTNYQYLDGATYVGETGISKMTATAYSQYIDDKLYYYSTQADMTADLTKKGVKAQIGENRYYTKFSGATEKDGALEKAATGDTIKLLAAYDTVTEAISITKEVTIDLNGKTISGTGESTISVTKGGNLTVKDTAGGGSVTNSNASGDVVKLESGGQFTLAGGTIQTIQAASGTNVPAGVNVGADSTFSMTGGNINVKGLGIANDGGNVSFSGGEIGGVTESSTTTNPLIGIYNRLASSVLNILGGLITGRTGVRMRAGSLGVTGGKILGIAPPTTNPGGSGENVAEFNDGALAPAFTIDGNNLEGSNFVNDNSTEGMGIAIAPVTESGSSSGSNTINVEVSGSGTEVSGTTAAVGINQEKTSGGQDATDSTVAVNASFSGGAKLSSVNKDGTANEEGSSLLYASKNTSNRVNFNAAILDNQVTVSNEAKENVSVGAEQTSSSTNNINFQNVAIKISAKAKMSSDEALKTVMNSINENLNLNGDGYQSNGQVTDYAIAQIAHSGDGTEVESYTNLQTAFNDAGTTKTIDSKEVTLAGTVSLLSSQTIGTQLTVGESMTNLDFNGKTLTYSGNENAALKVGANKTLTFSSADGLVGGGVEATAKDKVKVNGTNGGEATNYGNVKIVTATTSGDPATTTTTTTNTYFKDLSAAMPKLDGNEILTYVTDNALTDGKLSYSGDSTKAFGLDGLSTSNASKISISGSNFSLTADNFGNDGITMTKNGGSYTFKLSGSFTSGNEKTFTGSSAADKIENSIAKLTVSGGAGADSITNYAASATVNGGADADKITNQGKSAYIFGDAGADNIQNNGESATVYGGEGNDVIFNGVKAAYLFGDAGADTITNTYTLADDDETFVSLNGGAGNDQLTGKENGKNFFIYTAGKDTITNYSLTSDQVSLSSDVTPFTDVSKVSYSNGNLVLTYSDSNVLTFAGKAEASLKHGTDTYAYKANSSGVEYIAKNTDGVTLGAGFTAGTFTNSVGYETVDASAVTSTLTITDYSGDSDTNKNKNKNYYAFGTGSDTFNYASGSDSIYNYTYGTDVISLTSGTAPTDLEKGISYDSTASKFVVSLGTNGDSLTFDKNKVELKSGEETYYYEPDRLIKDGNEATLKSTFSSKTFNVQTLGDGFSGVASIDASKVTLSGGVNIIGNTVTSDVTNSIRSAIYGGTVRGGDYGNTLISSGANDSVSLVLRGGTGADSLVGGASADLFVYTGGTDSISGYSLAGGDVVRVDNNYRLSEAIYSVSSAGNGGKANISLGWGGTDNLIFEGIGSLEGVLVQQGTANNYYTYAQQYSAHNNSVTLASGHASLYNGTSSLYSDYQTINAAAVNNAISIMGNSLNNYIFGPTAANASIDGGIGNDKINVSDRDTKASYLFEYTSGKDEVIGFKSSDSVAIDPTKITAAKASNSNTKLALTVDKNKNVLTLRSDDEITKVSLSSGADYLTKDGYVEGQGLSLFGSARGQIDLNDTIYKDSNISLVAADSVKSQSVTLTGGTKGGTFIYAENNKRRDGFVYGGGAVSISGYEAGRDRIDLSAASLSSFTVGDKDVVLNVSGGTISISGAAGKEILLHDATKGRSYKKMVFKQTGVIENKQKNPTMVTVSGSPTGNKYDASSTPTIKKIYVTGLEADGVSIQAGDKNNTQIDASLAGKGVSLSGGAKNDKLIGSDENDLFVYNAGKDIIQGYSSDGDAISISSSLANSLSSAKITAGSKSIKFKFTNKDALTVKANKGETLDGSLTIGTTKYTYVKNAIENGGLVTLTSAFGGTFKTDDSKLDQNVTTVDGGAVSKNLTYKGTNIGETLTGGTKKTTFKGGGGGDSLVGGTGKDVFFYAKGEEGTTKIANFEFGANKDKLKIAGGTISQITSVESGAIEFAMNNGKNTSNIGWFDITSGHGQDSEKIDAAKVAIKANNTYYWFAKEDVTEVVTVDGGQKAVTLASAGQLITSDTRVSASDVSGLSVIDLNYSTNLAKAGVAVKVTGAKPK